MSLLIPLWGEILDLSDAALAINHGLNKVRFPAPVPVGSRIRLKARIMDVSAITDGVQVVVDTIIEAEGSTKPICIAEPVFRFLQVPKNPQTARAGG